MKRPSPAMGARRRRGRGFVGALAALLVLCVVAGLGWLAIDPHRGEAQFAPTTLPLDQLLSHAAAVEDLEFVAETIEDRHVWSTSGLAPRVAEAWQAELQALPAEPAVVDVWRATQRMLVALGDGHTFAAAAVPDDVAYAVDYHVIDGELQVDVDGAFRAVTSVNGVGVAELARRNRELTPADNEGWLQGRLVNRLRSRAHLGLLDAAPVGGYVVQHRDPAGAAQPLAVEEGAAAEPDGPVAEYSIDDALAVLTIHRCVVDDSYRAVLAEFFREVHERETERIVVDLRGNPGGNSGVTDLFVEYLDVGEIPTGSTKARFGPWVVPLGSGTMEGRKHETAFSGEILVLTDHGTFSSAADFATVLSDNNLARIIGAPPGSAPTGAGDVVVFELPHSGLFMQVSYKYFERPDPTRPSSVLEVDTQVDPTRTVEDMIASGGR